MNEAGAGDLLGGGGTSTTPAAPATDPAAPTTDPAASWHSTLSDDLKGNKTFEKFKDVNALAAAYVNAEKHISGDKLVVPSKHATPEEWQAVYRKLGVPEKAEDYKVKFNEKATIDDQFSKDFQAKFHALGIHPNQAQAVADWVSEMNVGANEKFMQSRKAKQDAEIADLKKEWGNAFDSKLAKANKLLKEHGGEEVGEYIKSSGLGNDTKIIRLLAAAADALYGEHKVVEGSSGKVGALTPGDAKKQALSIVANANHPYNQKDHPNHASAVKEVEELFQQAAL